MIRLYRAPWSTNCERVALALAHKGLGCESVWIDYGDRSPVEAVSGQGLVPVAELDGEVVPGSMAIVAELDRRHPQPPLYPAEPARRAEVEVFLDWFDRVWKRPPNQIEAELGRPETHRTLVVSLAAEMDSALDRFEAMLAGRDFLMGDALGAADVCAFPFLKYALRRDPADDELFHRILDDYQSAEGRPRLAAWIERVDALPRA